MASEELFVDELLQQVRVPKIELTELLNTEEMEKLKYTFSVPSEKDPDQNIKQEFLESVYTDEFYDKFCRAYLTRERTR